jgi:alginate O-acetyltransferase complex protein AlgI
LWHGASWAFVLWGSLHGVYLMVNHGFRAMADSLGWTARLDRSRAFTLFGWALTLLAVVVAWVLFRAQTLGGAGRVLLAMGSPHEAAGAVQVLLWNAGLQAQVGAGWCGVLGAMAFLLPNTNRIGEQMRLWFEASRDARLALGLSAMLACVFLVLLNAARDSVSAFIYFNF